MWKLINVAIKTSLATTEGYIGDNYKAIDLQFGRSGLPLLHLSAWMDKNDLKIRPRFILKILRYCVSQKRTMMLKMSDSLSYNVQIESFLKNEIRKDEKQFEYMKLIR